MTGPMLARLMTLMFEWGVRGEAVHQVHLHVQLPLHYPLKHAPPPSPPPPPRGTNGQSVVGSPDDIDV